MPDPSKATVSASQAPALFNQSPYLTRWMLFQHFANNLPIEAEPNERIAWGTLFQPAILRAASLELRLDVVANDTDQYQRLGKLGATIDGAVTCPDRGPGIVEVKNVDWFRFKDTWTETQAPPHIEIQIQTQMLVAGASWGVIAACVGGNELKLYERRPDRELHDKLREEAEAFFDSIKRGDEPDPLGSPLELPGLAKLQADTDPLEKLDATDDVEMAHWLDQYEWASAQARMAEKLKEQMKAKILARIGRAAIVRAHGFWLNVQRSTIPVQICTAEMVGSVLRKEANRTVLKVERVDDGPLPEETAELQGIAP